MLFRSEISIPFPSKLTCSTASSSKVQRNNFVTVIKSYLTLQESLQLHNVGLVTTMPRFFTPGPPGVRKVRPSPSLPCPRCQGEKGKGGANVAPPPEGGGKLGTWASTLKDDRGPQASCLSHDPEAPLKSRGHSRTALPPLLPALRQKGQAFERHDPPSPAPNTYNARISSLRNPKGLSPSTTPSSRGLQSRRPAPGR